MSDPNDVQTLWLNVTNIILGIVTAFCILAVCGVAIREIAGALRKRVLHSGHQGAHALVLSDLGITMADGGEKLDEKALPREGRAEPGRPGTSNNPPAST